MSTETAAPAPASKLELDAAGIPVVEGKSSEEVKAALEKAAKQVYFYFSDSNLPVDKFFFSLTACNAEGWVPIKTILTFKRMRDFLPFGVEAVAHALRQAAAAEGSDPLVAVSEDGANVRRARPLEPVTDAWSRSVYVKGFGEGDNEKNTQEKIEEWFEQFGKINAVRRRRGDLEGKGDKGKGKGEFKGSVFAEFAYAADVTKFLENKAIPKFDPGGEDMLVESKDAYVKRKCKEKGIPEDEIHKNTGGPRGKPARKFNAFREMEKQQKGMKPDLAKIPGSVDIVGKAPEAGSSDGKRKREDDGEGNDGKREKKERPPVTFEYKGVTLEVSETGEVKDPMQVPFEDGAAVKFTVEGEGDWKALKEAVVANAIPDVFMALPAGQKVGTIAKQDSSKITDDDLAKLNGANLKYAENPVQWSRMSEQEQRDFWVKRANYQAKLKWQEAKDARRSEWKDRRGGRGGRGGGRGGRGRGGRGGRGGGFRGGRGGDRNREKAAAGGDGLPPSVGAVKAE